ncbi:MULTISPECIES: hypothetical protein [unclassified Mesorhizobium]|nr:MULTISPECIES: hypothetical protein [unclassified Mesorhizobium]MBZ9767555.1 hypothetical protein [Mesorhizobium sp. CA6]MBZ9884637.1 hypothetical protein [Mesorhizobium sp. CA10]MBZ9913965.1 hypothetical protein [Mesorhizobium sp. CA16]
MLETRESRRADRLPGLARWQFERVHRVSPTTLSSTPAG